MKKQILHFKKHSIQFAFLTLLLLFFIPFISSTAQFNPIPNQNLEINTYSILDLDYYCFSDNPSLVCEYSSYGLDFINPDNNQQVVMFGIGEHSNSYFTISLTNGLIQILSKSKSINTQIIVYGADTPYSSQSSTTFNLNIQEILQPIQIANFMPPVLYGNSSIVYYMNDFFLYHTSISVSYTDDILNQTVFILRPLIGGQVCSEGQIKVCLEGVGNDVFLLIEGLNQSYDASVSGGNLMYVTAINSYGSTLAIPFPVIVYIAGAYADVPYRVPLSIAPVYMEFNASSGQEWDGTPTNAELYDNFSISYNELGYWYQNYTVLSATFTLYASLSLYDYNITYEYWNNGTMVFNRSDGPSGSNSYTDYDIYTQNITGYPEIFLVGFINSGDRFYMSSFDFLFNITVYTKACNDQGCITTDDFGNVDRYLVSVLASFPEAVPITIAPIVLGFHETKSIDINNYYSNYNHIITTWSEDTKNFSLRTPAINYNSTTYVSGLPVYQARLYFNNIFTVTSSNINHNFTVNLEACNFHGCINGTDFIPLTVLFIISDTSLGKILELQTSDAWWRGIFNLFLGFFPDSENLNSQQKGGMVIITISVIVIMIMFFGYKSGGSILPLIYVSAGLSFFLFLFFIAKGYISPVILVSIILVSLGMIFLKYKGGGGE